MEMINYAHQYIIYFAFLSLQSVTLIVIVFSSESKKNILKIFLLTHT